MNEPLVNIYQIYFSARQEKHLSPLFKPYFNQVRDGFYEAGVFKREFAQRRHLEQPYLGFVSWKFEMKSFVAANEFLALATEFPGRDVYFLNPFPELTGKFKNVWIQGAESHPGLLMLGQRIFDHVGVKVSLLDLINTPEDTLYCNYWYGSQRFWDSFMAFSAPFYALFEDQNSPFFAEIRASAKYHGGGTLIPFFMERLFPTFLALHPEITRQGYVWTAERRNQALEKMRHQLNLCEAQLDEIRTREESLPRWKRWLIRD